jgi:hypothetical protein
MAFAGGCVERHMEDRKQSEQRSPDSQADESRRVADTQQQSSGIPEFDNVESTDSRAGDRDDPDSAGDNAKDGLPPGTDGTGF